MLLIGLTGGIASGKSTVAQRFAERGAVVLDADQFARAAVAPNTPGLEQVVQRFGTQLLAADGSLDRAALGALVFADEQARRELEAIVHPEVQRLFEQGMREAVAANPAAVVVYDVPLLVEGASERPYDLVVTTQAGRERQIERMRVLRGYDLASAEARLDAQASDAARAERADIVIDTSGTLDHTLAQVDAVWERVSGRT